MFQVPPFIDFMVTWLALSNSFWNPFLYWLLNNHFRRVSKELLLSKVSVTVKWNSNYACSAAGVLCRADIASRRVSDGDRRVTVDSLIGLWVRMIDWEGLVTCIQHRTLRWANLKERAHMEHIEEDEKILLK